MTNDTQFHFLNSCSIWHKIPQRPKTYTTNPHVMIKYNWWEKSNPVDSPCSRQSPWRGENDLKFGTTQMGRERENERNAYKTSSPRTNHVNGGCLYWCGTCVWQCVCWCGCVNGMRKKANHSPYSVLRSWINNLINNIPYQLMFWERFHVSFS